MTEPVLTAATRRRLLLRAASLAATGSQPAAGPPLAQRSRAHPDAGLLRACEAFSAVERQKLRLFTGRGRVDDDDARNALLEPLADAQRAPLDAICQLRASTPDGHAARAICFLLWDGGELAYFLLWDGGELAYRAHLGDALEDRLLAALVRDLVDGAGR